MNRIVGAPDDQAPILGAGSTGERQIRDRHSVGGPKADLGRRGGGAELVGRALGDDLAANDDRDTVGEHLRLVHVVRGQEHGLAEFSQPGDQRPELAPGGRIEAGGRLVEEEQVGIADQSDADVEAAQLSAGEATRARLGLGAETNVLDRLVDARGLAVIAGVELERLANGEFGSHPALLEHDSDPLMPLTVGLCGVLAEHADLAGAALAIALEDLGRRGLARAVWPEEGEDLARLDLEVKTANRLEIAIRLVQSADRNDRLTHRTIICRRL